MRRTRQEIGPAVGRDGCKKSCISLQHVNQSKEKEEEEKTVAILKAETM